VVLKVRMDRQSVRLVRLLLGRLVSRYCQHQTKAARTDGTRKVSFAVTPAPPASPANERLAALLHRAGWRPEALARRLNAALAQNGADRRIHEKTPYKWIARGEVPHGDVPDLVIHVLATALDTELDYEDVWGGARQRPQLALCADDGMDLPWDSTGLISLLGEPVPTRRTVVAVAGAALTSPAWGALQRRPPTLISTADERGPVTPPLLTMIDTVVCQVQRLDEQQGGAARGFVSDQFVAVSRLLRRASYDEQTGLHLAAAVAQLAQTAGFMAFDAHDDGRAQRWYLIALRAAHAAADPALTASILALMSNQAADQGHALDAVQLASAAQEAATHAPAVVRSLVAARSGLAYAVAGDLSGFSHARENTIELHGAVTDLPLPPWASYIDRVELDAITGRGLVVLADHMPTRRKQLLQQAKRLLHARAHTDPVALQQRSALRHGAWLSLAHIADNDLELAVSSARLALSRLPAVSSARSVSLLHRLDHQLTPIAPRSPAVRLLLDDLRHLTQPMKSG
jgi:hypothetical protein